jgi:DNA helicase HerA-like ATPase
VAAAEAAVTVDTVPRDVLAAGDTLGWLTGRDLMCRVEEVYKPTAPAVSQTTQAPRDERARSTYSAVIAAYHQRLAQGRPLVVSWCRRETGGPITVACSTTPAAPEYPAALVFPPGTRGRPIDPGQVQDDLDTMHWWTPVAGTVDALVSSLDSQQSQGWAGDPMGLEQGLLPAWHGPFAWLLLAHPVSRDDLDKDAERLAARERDARARAASPQHAVRAERFARRHREVRAGRSTGMWRVRLLAGGVDVPSAAAVAGLLVAAQDLRGTPYTLAPLNPMQGLEAASVARIEDEDETQVPFLAGPRLLAALAQVPATEIPGVRLVQRSTFDVTLEGSGPGGERTGFELGTILDRDGLPAAPLRIRPDTLNRHAFVCGSTGAGKSQTVRTLLEELARAADPVPWLVIEPAKAEYARMAGRLQGHSEVLVIRPGDLDALPGSLNPLEPEPGFPLQTHIDLVRALFLAAFEAIEPFPQVLAHALNRCYRELDWDVTLGEPRNRAIRPRYPTLGDLQRAALNVVDEIGYGDEMAADVRGFIDVRIGSLRLGTPGRFFEGGHPLDVADLMRRNTVLELEDIGNDQDKAFFIGTILIRLIEYLRIKSASFGPQVRLRHVTVIEEAHRLLKRAERGSPAAHAVEMFAGLLAEIRAYGEGIVVAEQIPAKIVPDVVKNSALKIVHRLPAHDDRQSVGATMNLTEEQSRHLVTLTPGLAAVFTDGMDNPVLAAMPLRELREDAARALRTPAIHRTRSAACGTECRASACTLREIARAGHLADDPKLTLWIELLIVTHLLGRPVPQPDQTWLGELSHRAGTKKSLQCALAHRIQVAIDSRYTGLSIYYQPETLAAHLAIAAMSALERHPTCQHPEVEWQAGTFRWADIYRALESAEPNDPPHPDTHKWARRGLHLPGSSIAEQLEALNQRPETWATGLTVIQGMATPRAYDIAASELNDHPKAATRLAKSSEFLAISEIDWISSVLCRDTSDAESTGT